MKILSKLFDWEWTQHDCPNTVSFPVFRWAYKNSDIESECLYDPIWQSMHAMRYDKATQHDMTEQCNTIWQSNAMRYHTTQWNDSITYSFLPWNKKSDMQISKWCNCVLYRGHVYMCSNAKRSVYVKIPFDFFSWSIFWKSKSLHIIVLNSWSTHKY